MRRGVDKAVINGLAKTQAYSLEGSSIASLGGRLLIARKNVYADVNAQATTTLVKRISGNSQK